MVLFLIAFSALFVFYLFHLSKFKRYLLTKTHLPLPPGPAGLPIIGNLHQLETSNLSDHLWRLSKDYGPLMSLRLGHVQTLVVSSAEMAKEILKTHDLVFCTRPVLTGQQKLSYNNKDVALSPYSEYWRQMKKICTLHLFSAKQVNSFRSVREEEVFDMIDTIKSRIATKQVVNLSETVTILTSNMISRVAFGKRTYGYIDEQKEVKRFQELLMECQALLAKFYYRDHFPLMGWLDKLNGSIDRLEKNFNDLDEIYQELIDEHLNPNRPNKTQDDMVDILLKVKQEYSNSGMELTFDHIKAVLMNILFGGTETSASAVVWAMTLLIKNPKSLKKAQQEVRNVMGNKGKVQEDDLQKLYYLKAVIKETLRLYPVAPLLVPRESRDRCILDRYEIPKGTLVYVNAWAVGRDPKCWENPEEFEPERFMGSSIDYKGMDFELIPFGSGRRGCPGMLLGATTVELTLSNLVYSFDWELPDGTTEIDTLTTPGTVSHKKTALRLVANVHDYDRLGFEAF
ncbi:cytochrome P450 71A1-like [Cynara cardunculus var. scolymus]|uniref:Cytochrome P450 n=1 Tax=Cynara cardunculus var. scolymus TaxID=59895 RepID=A0A118JYP4_CYNCS|nr:cytochrome P450 71A1-like [Cynara cardunculus var. scolymus]KVH98471.1 cytochrome P450 [Cynara cardunculus var. scolymus]